MADRKIKLSIDIVSGSGGTQKIRGTLNDVDAEVKRINKQTAAGAKQTQKVIEEAVKSRIKNELAEEKRAEREKKKIANDFITSLKRVEAASKASASRSASHFSSAFKGGFFGGLVGAASAQLAQLPSMLKSKLDEMVAIAAERQNAFKGLESIAVFKGVDPAAAQNAVKDLRLVKAGVVDVGDGVTGLKNLLATGFSLPQSIQLMERFSDSAAFGKQAALSYGDAIRSATEGIKNQNSILVDNAGVTKNISVILKEHGFKMEDLSDKTKKQSALQALYNGLLSETQAQVGDADKLTQGYTGTVAALDTAKKNLYATIGDLITQNPQFIALIKTMTVELNTNTTALQDNNSQTRTTFNDWITWTSKATISVTNFVDRSIAAWDMMQNALASGVVSIVGSFQFAFGAIAKIINTGLITPLNLMIDLMRKIPGAGAIPGFGFLAGMPDFPMIPDTRDSGLASFRQAKGLMRDGSRGIKDADARSKQRWADFERFSAEPVAPNTPRPTGQNPGGNTIMPGADPGGGRGGKGSRSQKERGLSSAARSIIAHAEAIGIDPIDYATKLYYDGGGSLSTSKWGGGTKGKSDWMTYLGPFQFSKDNQKTYGVTPGMPLDKYLDKVNKYLIDRGVKPGMGLPELYTAQNYGNVHSGVKWDAKDANGTIRQHLVRMTREHRPLAEKLLQGYKGRSTENDVDRMLAEQSESITRAERERILRASIAAYEAAGLLPDDDLIKDFHQLMVEEAKKKGKRQPTIEETTETFAGGAVLTGTERGPIKGREDALKRFAGVRLSGLRSPAAFEPQDLTARQLPEDEQRFLDMYNEEYKIKDRTTELDRKRKYFAQDLRILTLDYTTSLKEAGLQLKTEAALLDRRNLKFEAANALERERQGLTREIGDLQIELANQGKNDDLKIQAQLYRDILEIRGRELDAVMRISKAQLELQGAMTVSNTQIRAGVYEHIAAQKTLNQAVVDGINGTYDAILGRMNEPLDKLNQKTKGFLSFVIEPLKAMNANRLGKMFTGIVDKIFPGMGSEMEKAKNPVVGELKDHTKLLQQIVLNTGGSVPGLGSITNGGKGGFLNNILGGFNFRTGQFGGPGSGPGGTPWFNPNGGGSNNGFDGLLNSIVGGFGGRGGTANPFSGRFITSGQAGINTELPPGFNGPGRGVGGAPWKNFFGKGGFFGDKGFGFNAGTGAGLGGLASIAGGMMGGRMGGVLSMAGMGAQIGSFFGPWGSIIGAGAGALIGLFTGRDDAEKKLKEAAISEFGITVREKSVLKQLKAIGEGMFGKGQVGKNANAVVRSEEGMNILRAYAESSGQSGLKIDRLNYGDPNWKGNDFRTSFGGFRASGGPVTAGRAYVVGESRPELFVPAVNGTILPSTTTTSTTSGTDTRMMQAMLETLDGLKEQIGRLQGISPTHVVAMGAPGATREIADAYETELDNDGMRPNKFFRSTGL